jgi:hypothetical protein
MSRETGTFISGVPDRNLLGHIPHASLRNAGGLEIVFNPSVNMEVDDAKPRSLVEKMGINSH